MFSVLEIPLVQLFELSVERIIKSMYRCGGFQGHRILFDIGLLVNLEWWSLEEAGSQKIHEMQCGCLYVGLKDR